MEYDAFKEVQGWKGTVTDAVKRRTRTIPGFYPTFEAAREAAGFTPPPPSKRKRGK